MLHYTLNTGHSRDSLPEEVGGEVIEKMKKLLRPGAHDMGQFGEIFSGYRLVVPVVKSGFIATLEDTHSLSGELLGYRLSKPRLISFANLAIRPMPILTMGVARHPEDEEEIWKSLLSIYTIVQDVYQAAPAKKPSSLPWTAVVLIMPTILSVRWLPDFERSLAWTFVQN